jgi:hypothetical protein
MKTLFDWLESLSLREGVILYLVICIVACVLICGLDWWFRTAEIRAIKRRDNKLFAADMARRAERRQQQEAQKTDAQKKREADMEKKWGLLAFPYERSRRIPDKDLDRAHRHGQFSVPRSMNDMKGVHKL